MCRLLSIAFAAVVIAAIAAAAWWYFVGKQSRSLWREGFSGAKGAKAIAAAAAKGARALEGMSSKERELFQNLQNNNYTTAQIDDMIQSGILNAKIVNKFLAALNVAV